MQEPDKVALDRERDVLLQNLEDWLETPELVLAFVWLALLVAEFVWGQTLALRIFLNFRMAWLLRLALYAFAVFGYVTATLIIFFVDRDAEDEQAELAGANELAALRAEVSALRADIRTLSEQRPEA